MSLMVSVVLSFPNLNFIILFVYFRIKLAEVYFVYFRNKYMKVYFSTHFEIKIWKFICIVVETYMNRSMEI